MRIAPHPRKIRTTALHCRLKIIAVSGTMSWVRVSEGQIVDGKSRSPTPHSPLPELRIHAFLSDGKMGWSAINKHAVGSSGFFDRSVAIAAGYDGTSFAEDMVDYAYGAGYVWLLTAVQGSCRFDTCCWTEDHQFIYALQTAYPLGTRTLPDAKYHHKMIFKRPISRWGCLRCPMFVFEFLAPIIEVVGFTVIPVSGLYGSRQLEYSLDDISDNIHILPILIYCGNHVRLLCGHVI